MKIDKQIIRHYTLSDGDYQIQMTLFDTDMIKIKTYKGDHEFIFSNIYDHETLEKWDKVLNLMKKAVKLAREKLEGKNKGGDNDDK
jgi:hypothetical protein